MGFLIYQYYETKSNTNPEFVEYSNTFLPADNAINQHLVKIELHSHLMGKARTKHEGNISTIRTKIWDN